MSDPPEPTVDLARTRTALHGIVELLLAGPQYAISGDIRLRAHPGGIATVAEPDLRVEGGDPVHLAILADAFFAEGSSRAAADPAADSTDR